jgi:hypothetical protein
MEFRITADQLLPSSLADVDGNVEERRNTISVFNGSMPTVKTYQNSEKEIEAVSKWITDRIQSGLQPDEIGVFVRDKAQIDRAIATVERAGGTPKNQHHLQLHITQLQMVQNNESLPQR